MESLQLGAAVIGDFNTAYNIGSLAGIALLGWVAERLGSRGVIHVASVFQLVAPLIALGVALWSSTGGVSTAALWLMIGVSAIVGLVNHSMMLGFLNYTLDAAPPEKRSMYIGALNLLFGTMALLMPVGGIVINEVGRLAAPVIGYAALFGLCALLAFNGLLLTFKLPHIKHA
jgi:MFS family permease